MEMLEVLVTRSPPPGRASGIRNPPGRAPGGRKNDLKMLRMGILPQWSALLSTSLRGNT